MVRATLLICILSACSFGDDLGDELVATATCGDGVVEGNERCDDGNTEDGDGCSANCREEGAVAECGDGTIDPGEQCDDGNNASGDGCSSTCREEGPNPNECGDGNRAGNEECDDGNTSDGDGCSALCTTEVLMFSEYVEGAGNDKAIEIVNAGLTPLDIAGCELRLYSNGAAAPSVVADLTPTGVIPAGDVIVICHGSASLDILDRCDFTGSTIVNFNGDDALELACGGATVDAIGQIGVDPGSTWGTGDLTTLDHTLRRSCAIESGETNATDAFDVSGWVSFDPDDVSDLGLGNCVL